MPIALAIAVVIGIYIGKIFFANKQNIIPYSASFNKLDLVLDYIQNDYVDSIGTNDLIEKTIPMVLEQLDPHSSYIAAEEFAEVNDPLEGKFEGIGVQFNIRKDTIYIVQIIAGGPAEKVNMMAGDRIVKVEDSLVAGIGISNNDVMKLLKGPKGTKVRVEVKRGNNQELIPFTLTRDKIPFHSIDASYMIDKNIAYMKISRFAMTTNDEFIEHISKLKAEGMTKLIIDLRGNGGGMLHTAIELANQFLPEGALITYTEGHRYPRQEYRANDKGLCKNTDLVILVDEGSASASEVLSGAIQDNDRGTIVGRRTFGKGLVMDQRMFRDGSAIRLTVSKYYSPSGRCIQRPYKLGGSKEYYQEIEERFLNGEMQESDSIHNVDSLIYKTIGGRTVYGGGGITPDSFVAIDTTGYSKYLARLTNQGLIYEYAFEYSDKNRNKLSQFTSATELVDYLEQSNVVDSMVDYASKHGVEKNDKELEMSRWVIENRLYAYICRNIMDDKGFYPIFLKIDNTYQKAIEILKE